MIKLATKSDIEEIQNLLLEDTESYQKLAMTGCFEAKENDMWNVMFVSKHGTAILGFIKAIFYSDPGRVYISGVYTNKQYRKKGVARELMKYLLNFADKAWTHMFISGVTLDNPASEALFKSCGFDNMGTIKKATYKNGWLGNTHWWKKGNI